MISGTECSFYSDVNKLLFLFLTAACYNASVVVWTFKYVETDPHGTHGWSFWCAVGAALALPIAAILMVVSAVRKHEYERVSTQ